MEKSPTQFPSRASRVEAEEALQKRQKRYSKAICCSVLSFAGVMFLGYLGVILATPERAYAVNLDERLRVPASHACYFAACAYAVVGLVSLVSVPCLRPKRPEQVLSDETRERYSHLFPSPARSMSRMDSEDMLALLRAAPATRGATELRSYPPAHDAKPTRRHHRSEHRNQNESPSGLTRVGHARDTTMPLSGGPQYESTQYFRASQLASSISSSRVALALGTGTATAAGPGPALPETPTSEPPRATALRWETQCTRKATRRPTATDTGAESSRLLEASAPRQLMSRFTHLGARADSALPWLAEFPLSTGSLRGNEARSVRYDPPCSSSTPRGKARDEAADGLASRWRGRSPKFARQVLREAVEELQRDM